MTTEPEQIRPLSPGDFQSSQVLRLAALALAPEAFLTTLEEERARSDMAVAERPARRRFPGVFRGDGLGGSLALDPETAEATRHRI